ncbi:MAG: hypothetical protein GKR93_02900 [Gammaproteobacteria bacterium]|nr:hypothetical protein [Gammaproteobacteria bacterium]
MKKSNVFIVSFCLLTVIFSSHAVYSNISAHEHQGILTPYLGEPERIVLKEKDFQKLKKGKAIFKKQLVGDNKRAVVITRVKADSSTIWSVIKDFDSYPEWIDDIKSMEIYRQEESTIYVRFDVENRYSGKVTWYARHNYPSDSREWGTWTLDYDRMSDLDDSVGFWRVSIDPEDPAYSLVFYSTSLKLKTRVPQFIVRIIINAKLKQSTQWVQQQSESRMTSMY